MTIEWKDSYCIGEESIDRQHRELFQLANAMFAAADQSAMRLCAMKLYKHVREHFADEEALMKMVHFPGYQAHVDSHNRILLGLNTISQAIGNNTIDPAVATAFLTDWGLNHIPKEDAQVAAFLNKQ